MNYFYWQHSSENQYIYILSNNAQIHTFLYRDTSLQQIGVQVKEFTTHLMHFLNKNNQFKKSLLTYYQITYKECYQNI